MTEQIIPNPEFEKLKQLMTAFFAALKSLDTEACTYRMTEHALRTVYRDIATEGAAAAFFSISLMAAQQSPAVQEIMRKKYDARLEEWLKSSEQSGLEKVAHEWLHKWKPEERPN